MDALKVEPYAYNQQAATSAGERIVLFFNAKLVLLSFRRESRHKVCLVCSRCYMTDYSAENTIHNNLIYMSLNLEVETVKYTAIFRDLWAVYSAIRDIKPKHVVGAYFAFVGGKYDAVV